MKLLKGVFNMKIRIDRVIFAIMIFAFMLLLLILLLAPNNTDTQPDVAEVVIVTHDLSTDERQSQRALIQSTDGVLKIYTDTGDIMTIMERERND